MPHRRVILAHVSLAASLLACTEAPPTEPPALPTKTEDPAAAGSPPTAPSSPEGEDAPQFDFQGAGDGQAEALYAAPVIERARALRRGRKVRLRLRWSSVVDADTYELQVARNLTFASTNVTKQVTKRTAITPPLTLGLYFVRVRAMGPLGAGPWSAAKAIAPRDAARAVEPSEEPPLIAEPPANVADPLTLRLFGLPERSLSPSPSIEIRGRSTQGAEVSAGGEAVSADPDFQLTLKLAHGRNEVTVTATRGEERVERRRIIYYADPRRVQRDLAQLRILRQQLEDLRGIQREVRIASRELEGALEGASANEAERLSAELDEIQRASAQLESEVETAFAALQKLLE